MDEFTLTIRLGNDAMQTGGDVAEALRKLADRIDTYRDGSFGANGRIMDANGNDVGEWMVTL
jgi:hypothetical protein